MEIHRKNGYLLSMKIEYMACVLIVLSVCSGAEAAAVVTGEQLEPALGTVVSLDPTSSEDPDAAPKPSGSPSPATIPEGVERVRANEESAKDPKDLKDLKDLGNQLLPTPDPRPRNASQEGPLETNARRPPVSRNRLALSRLPAPIRLFFVFLYYALPTINMFLLNPSLARTIDPILEYFFGSGYLTLLGSTRTLRLVVSVFSEAFA
ncbi:uncharacterized protein LOC122263110 isoform X2 [Penaeus japonicus]|uniref:uncharacterized protein LOC122263110 isoform X2 n=1 Tax=Penaeus japonicus TaxID=27405 RepID=UPI001C711CCA|nr:uncharacterized protein LOC122263110 isoform X2 [Penaeus japonicus]